MRKLNLLAAASLLAVLGACSSTTPPTAATVQADVNAAVPVAFKYGCAAVSYADGAFKAASPALVISGKLSADQVTQERAIMSSVEITCATPPADAATAGLALLGQASAIYLMLAPQS